MVLISIPDGGASRTVQQTVLQRLRRLDLIGFVILGPATIQLILALQWGGIKYSWNSATIIGLFCGAFATLLVFLVWESSMGKEAMIPLYLIRRRIIWSSCLNIAFFVGCAFTTTYYFPIYFQAVRGASPTLSGVDVLPQVLVNMVATIFTGALGMPPNHVSPAWIAKGRQWHEFTTTYHSH